jgi:hypothetical protein
VCASVVFALQLILVRQLFATFGTRAKINNIDSTGFTFKTSIHHIRFANPQILRRIPITYILGQSCPTFLDLHPNTTPIYAHTAICCGPGLRAAPSAATTPHRTIMAALYPHACGCKVGVRGGGSRRHYIRSPPAIIQCVSCPRLLVRRKLH